MARAKKSQATDRKQGARAMKPVVLMVGADKGGVGKTTVHPYGSMRVVTVR